MSQEDKPVSAPAPILSVTGIYSRLTRQQLSRTSLENVEDVLSVIHANAAPCARCAELEERVKDWKHGANAEAREVDAAHAKIAEQAAVISGYKADQQEQLQIQVEQAELITAIYNIVSEPALKKFGATAVIFDLIAAYKEQTK